MLVLPVIAQTILFGYAATFDLDEVPYAVLDESHGAASTRILAKMDGSGIFRRVATLRVPADIARCINAGEALLVLHMPPESGFTAHRRRHRARSGHPRRTQLHHPPASPQAI